MDNRVITRSFVIWAVLATLLTISMTALKLTRPYDNEPHTWASAHMGIMAKNFAQNGVVVLRGIPIINNPPFDKTADAYIDWPPLYPIVLGTLFRRFGESEATARALALVFSLVYLGIFYLLVTTLVDRQTAVAAVFAAQVLPIFVVYSSIWTVNAGLAMSLLAFLALYKATAQESLDWTWTVIGALALITGVGLSWEPLLLMPSLLPLCIWQRRRLMTRVVLTYGTLAVLAALALLVFYVSSFPELKATLVKAVSDRLGMGHNLGGGELAAHSRQRVTELRIIVSGLFLLLGELPIVAIGCCLLWMREKRTAENGNTLVLLFAGLVLPWLLWYVIFPQHVVIHEYQLLLAVPVAAFSIAIALVDLGRRLLSGIPEYRFRWIPLGVVPAVLLVSGIRAGQVSLTDTLKKPPSSSMRYAKDLRDNTERDSVILSPFETLQVTYYADRHVVRGIADDLVLGDTIRRLSGEFPRTRIYLAIPLESVDKFPSAINRFAAVRRNDNLVLLDIAGQVASGATEKGLNLNKVAATRQNLLDPVLPLSPATERRSGAVVAH